MAEGSCPQVFVVDHQIHCPPPRPPATRRPSWSRARRGLLLPLVGLLLLGLVLEGVFILRLYRRTEAFSQFLSYSLAQNQSGFRTPALDGHIMGQVGNLVSNEVHLEETREKPMAHLQGSPAVSDDGVVQWVKNNDGFTAGVDYNSSGLVIKTKGYYYLYCKVHFQETDDCAMVSHRVIRNTTKYGEPIELLKSKSLHCRNQRPNQKNVKNEKDLWNSFLAGVFKLEIGDHVFVTLDKGLYPGPADNFFGAFMMA